MYLNTNTKYKYLIPVLKCSSIFTCTNGASYFEVIHKFNHVTGYPTVFVTDGDNE